MQLLFDSHTIRTKLDADPCVGPELKVAQSKQKKRASVQASLSNTPLFLTKKDRLKKS
jgi:hypothetical protein